MSKLVMTVVSGEHIVPVDFSLPYGELIGVGSYAIVNENVLYPDHFPIEGSGKYIPHMVYVGFDRKIQSLEELEEAREAMRAGGIAPANLVYTARFGMYFPDYLQSLHLVGLGQNWKGFNGCMYDPCAASWVGKPFLGVASVEEGGYDTNCRFPGIKINPTA